MNAISYRFWDNRAKLFENFVFNEIQKQKSEEITFANNEGECDTFVGVYYLHFCQVFMKDKQKTLAGLRAQQGNRYHFFGESAPKNRPLNLVQASTSQGSELLLCKIGLRRRIFGRNRTNCPVPNEITLSCALFSTQTVDRLTVSPPFCGSNPYPCGSLTYRNREPVGHRFSLFSLQRADSLRAYTHVSALSIAKLLLIASNRVSLIHDI